MLDGGPTQAEHWLSRYGGAWNGRVEPIFSEAGLYDIGTKSGLAESGTNL